jgi:hypothetical protein
MINNLLVDVTSCGMKQHLNVFMLEESLFLFFAKHIKYFYLLYLLFTMTLIFFFYIYKHRIIGLITILLVPGTC